jgi:hypothetical protein
MLKREEEDVKFLQGRDPGQFHRMNEERADRREYWYRIYNDGRCDTLDNWPMRAEYFAYKHWVDSIQDKAMGTLQYTVNRLLVDFESDESVGNNVVEFSKGKKETKREALERLLVALNERAAKGPSASPRPTGAARTLRDTKRTSPQIKRDFNKMID